MCVYSIKNFFFLIIISKGEQEKMCTVKMSAAHWKTGMLVYAFPWVPEQYRSGTLPRPISTWGWAHPLPRDRYLKERGDLLAAWRRESQRCLKWTQHRNIWRITHCQRTNAERGNENAVSQATPTWILVKYIMTLPWWVRALVSKQANAVVRPPSAWCCSGTVWSMWW